MRLQDKRGKTLSLPAEMTVERGFHDLEWSCKQELKNGDHHGNYDGTLTRNDFAPRSQDFL